MSDIFKVVRESCSPQVWSKGIELARRDTVTGDRASRDEILFRVLDQETGVSPEVKLWPEDEDWQCSCHSKDDPCMHVAAAVIALRRAQEQGQELPHSKHAAGKVAYRFKRTSEGLYFHRYAVTDLGQEMIAAPLSSIATGRVEGPAITVSKQDLAIESILGTGRFGILDARVYRKLIPALKEVAEVTLDGQPVGIDPHPLNLQVLIEDEGPAIRLSGIKNPIISETWHNAVALALNKLHPVRLLDLDSDEIEILKNSRLFGPQESYYLASEILPRLQAKVEIINRSRQLPTATYALPYIEINLESEGGRLRVFPYIIYGDPAIARVTGGRLHILGTKVPLRDIAEETRLSALLRRECGLELDQSVTIDRSSAVKLVERIKLMSATTKGSGLNDFSLFTPLLPTFKVTENNFTLEFRSGSREDTSEETLKFAGADEVLRAWQAGESLVELLDGGFAPLPSDWLAKYGDKILELMAARDDKEELAKSSWPLLATLAEELGEQPPLSLSLLKEKLHNFEKIPAATIDPVLASYLRPYQKIGVNWLAFLKEIELGAMLADDMGLGKTLQSIAVMEKRTLVVAPTSVIFNWRKELERFRPDLKVQIYHGADRTTDDEVDVILTTYGILRIEIGHLASYDWKMVVLDEAQNIKNPQSQITRAAYQLKAPFKLVLTGTPIENSLNDLWSQFNFINPGLLGSGSFFNERFIGPIKQASEVAAERLRQKIKPFFLRRLKRDVAPELPARTENILYAQFDPEEEKLYNALYASARREVRTQLGNGRNLFDILELLLRLRQACCHMALLPDQTAPSSSKTRLLIENLEQTVAENHKVLVFSQWTSFLDLLEPALQAAAIPFSRLDGSSRDREKIVSEFQSKAGPPVLIMSLKAGGVGLNLTAADHVFIMDPWWNPAVEDQAADRAHRIGQTRPVFIHRLVAINTIEEKILDLQNHKRSVANNIIDAKTSAASLTKEDILGLFEDAPC